ncbi:glycosyltransferase [Exiguobacterium sp. s141]|uniref:glycosyltransferase n=1 Tax=Exiguobacterium sp. s141 TaxID=2751240 RepID=UPI001BE7ECD0|nr:glycosyltransferase [Exiguobacterium sp. s141]
MDVRRLLSDVQAHTKWVRAERERISQKEPLDEGDVVLINDLPSLTKKAQLPYWDDAKLEAYHTALEQEWGTASERFPSDASSFPSSNGTAYYYKKKLIDVAFVGPVERAETWRNVCNIHTFSTVTEFLELINAGVNIEFLMISPILPGEAATSFEHMGTPRSHSREWLEKLIKQANYRDIPTVFHTEADTNHYARFASLAAKCDVVFTANEERVQDYTELCNHDRVFVIKPFVNQLLHNPIGMTRPRLNDVLVTNDFPMRNVFMDDVNKLMDGVLETDHQLFVTKSNRDQHTEVAEAYRPYLVASETNMDDLKKSVDWILHVNEVKNSPTYCAQEIYDAQARGNLVLTNYNIAVNNDFPNVFIATGRLDAKQILSMFKTEDEMVRQQLSGVRTVMGGHTLHDRFEEMLFALGLETETLGARPVLVVGSGDESRLQAMIDAQTYASVRFRMADAVTETDLQETAFVAFFDSAYTYEAYYLEDMINAFKYTDVSFVTKAAYFDGKTFVTGPEHDYVTDVTDVHRSVFVAEQLSLKEVSTRTLKTRTLTGYAIDRYELVKGEVVVTPNAPRDYKLSVVVPVYNNGRYLYNKCFFSLKRSSMFDDMEIWLVDDGSTDNETARYVERLAREHANVYTYSFADGGSGSASRPRNKGVELATTPYIAFLDPDNEAVNDGYHELYQLMTREPGLDLAVGSMLKLSNREAMIELEGLEKDGIRMIEDPRAYLLEHNFKVQSIQAMVIRRDFIVENGLKQVIGAVGQDSLFFQEMFLSAERVALVDLTIHDYYAAVAGSTVNTITRRYFEKCLLRETARAKAFEREGVLDVYRETRFERFFELWYLQFIRRSREEDFLGNADLLYAIYEQFKPLEPRSPRFKQFIDLYESGQKNELKRLYFDVFR